MRLRLIVFVAVLVLGVDLAVAQPGGTDTSFPFLRLEPSARAAALTGAFTAVADGDVNALFYNPSIPSSSTSQRASFSYLNHLSDINAGSVAYSHTLRRGGRTTLHGGVRFAHWGTIEGRNEVGEPTGDFGAQDVALTMGGARPLGSRFRYGGSLHLIHSSIESAEVTAVALDLGGMYRIPPQQLTLGASLRNVGLALDRFGTARPKLPLDLQLGVTKRLTHLPVLLSVTAYDLTNLSDGIEGGTTLDHVLAHLTVGAELQPGEVLRLRLGYNHRRSAELAFTDRFDLAGFGGGFGLNVDPISVNYAFTSWSSLGGLHQFSVRIDVAAL